MQEFLNDGGGTLLARLKETKSPEDAAGLIVKTVLCRPPTAEESAAIVDYLRRRGDRPAEAHKQAVWALLAGAEFRFNY
jgi:hypothetical protein